MACRSRRWTRRSSCATPASASRSACSTRSRPRSRAKRSAGGIAVAAGDRAAAGRAAGRPSVEATRRAGARPAARRDRGRDRARARWCAAGRRRRDDRRHRTPPRGRGSSGSGRTSRPATTPRSRHASWSASRPSTSARRGRARCRRAPRRRQRRAADRRGRLTAASGPACRSTGSCPTSWPSHDLRPPGRCRLPAGDVAPCPPGPRRRPARRARRELRPDLHDVPPQPDRDAAPRLRRRVSPERLANRAEALVRGLRVPLVGNVTMDAVMADVTDVPGRPVGPRRRVRPARLAGRGTHQRRGPGAAAHHQHLGGRDPDVCASAPGVPCRSRSDRPADAHRVVERVVGTHRALERRYLRPRGRCDRQPRQPVRCGCRPACPARSSGPGGDAIEFAAVRQAPVPLGESDRHRQRHARGTTPSSTRSRSTVTGGPAGR